MFALTNSEDADVCRVYHYLILRAWYGLGQAYELLQQRNQALFYYSKTVFLRPYDARYVIGSAAVP